MFHMLARLPIQDRSSRPRAELQPLGLRKLPSSQEEEGGHTKNMRHIKHTVVTHATSCITRNTYYNIHVCHGCLLPVVYRNIDRADRLRNAELAPLHRYLAYGGPVGSEMTYT